MKEHSATRNSEVELYENRLSESRSHGLFSDCPERWRDSHKMSISKVSVR